MKNKGGCEWKDVRELALGDGLATAMPCAALDMKLPRSTTSGISSTPGNNALVPGSRSTEANTCGMHIRSPAGIEAFRGITHAKRAVDARRLLCGFTQSVQASLSMHYSSRATEVEEDLRLYRL